MLGKPFSYLLLKVAMRCNIDCGYCYWFRDPSVYEKPKVLSEAAKAELLRKLEVHIGDHQLKDFYILLHGGEPLLYGKTRSAIFFSEIEALMHRTGCVIHLSMTTNGILIDDDWIALFKQYKVDLTVSIDGPPKIHDRFRVDFQGRGTGRRVTQAITLLKSNGITPGVLSVCDPDSDPDAVVEYLSDDLGLKKFDILIPDATHEDAPKSIAPYFVRLFDLWYEHYFREGVDIRYISSMLKGLLGGVSKVESIGYGPINTVCMLTDGSLEPLDVIRITGHSATKTEMNIFQNTFEDLKACTLWREIYASSMRLSQVCLNCDYVQACGGGFLPHRYSKTRGFDNPSVYCEDLKVVFGHIWARVEPRIRVRSSQGASQALSSADTL